MLFNFIFDQIKKKNVLVIKYRTLHDPLESRRFTASLIAKKPELSTI
jgi:hypothetical protein